MRFNPILATDSYKLSHAMAYPNEVDGMFAYISARVDSRQVIVPFGLQIFIKDFLSVRITTEDIDEAEVFAKAHGEPFNREGWEYIVKEYRGAWPVEIYAVPEGTPVRGGNVLVTIECSDPMAFWTVMYLETALQRAVWYPTTIATLDYEIKREITNFYRISGADAGMIQFSLHDFGGRGVTSPEQARIGGAAHLVNFMGSDTIEGVRAANFYYSHPMAAFSVPATEHSVECAFGESAEDEARYIEHVLTTYAKPGAIVSIVIDGYNTMRAAKMLCEEPFRSRIMNSGAKIVFRPDSGDMMQIVPAILRMQAEAFGYDTNDKGYKKVRHVGILQGDGVDHMAIKSLLGKIVSMGFSADNIVFGSGGALLQKVNRDTYRFAQKASAILVGGRWVGISKKPATDPTKASLSGRQTLLRNKLTGEYSNGNIDSSWDAEFEEVMQLVYWNGQVFNETTLDQVRERCKI